MGSTTAAGSTLAMSVAHPATEDAAGYVALTFTTIGGVEKIGGFGAVFAKVEFQPLNGPKEKHKGSADYGSLAPSMAFDDADAGQTMLRTASDDATSTLYSFKITFPSGAIRYSQGRVFGFPENVDGADSVIMANPTIELSKKVVKVPAP
jgi:hypothetical protein